MTFSRLRIPLLMLTLVAACLTQGTLISPRISGSENNPLWTQTSGPPGGSFQVIEISPKDSNILFAGSNRSLFRSADRGEHWQRLEALHQLSASQELRVSLVAFHPRNPEIVYAVTQAGVFKSPDNGLTWESLSQQLERRGVRTMAIDPLESDTLYLALDVGEGKSELHKSTNGGKTWRNLTQNFPRQPQINILAVVKADELYAGGGFEMGREGNLYHSTNGGKSWEILELGQGEEPGYGKT